MVEPYCRRIGETLLRVFLCGRIQLVHGDRIVDETALPGTLGRAALAALAIGRGRLSHDELAERLWPGEPPLDGRKALAPLLSKVRRALRDVEHEGLPSIDARDGGYELSLPPDVWVDLEDAVRRLDRAEAALRRDAGREAWADAAPASAVLRRRFLVGFDAPWADRVRADLDDARYRTLLVISEVWRRDEAFPLARRAVRDAIAVDPYREDAHRLLIRIELDSGNRATARAAAEDCIRTLRDEMGVPPSPPTQALIDAATSS